MGHLVDTSTLMRWANQHDPGYRDARQAVRTLRRRGDLLCVVPQNVYEFWVVCTRPLDRNGLGLPTAVATRQVARLETLFPLLVDPSGLYKEWKRLVTLYQVSGKPAHDARLVAAMRLHGVESGLTFNVSDFRRYAGVQAIHPRDVTQDS